MHSRGGDDPVYSLHVITRRQAGKPRSRDVSHIAGRERHVVASSESIPTLKNRESIHFGLLLRGFVEKESIHDSSIHESILYYVTIHNVK